MNQYELVNWIMGIALVLSAIVFIGVIIYETTTVSTACEDLGGKSEGLGCYKYRDGTYVHVRPKIINGHWRLVET